MSYLEVPGASLYFESVGEGPLLLCISGGNGNVEPWRGFAQCLKDRFQVVMYDRRGFSRSFLSATEAQDYDHRLDTDADDAAQLIKHFSKEPATVIGNSSGALISLQLLCRHPDLIKFVVPHEPPALRFLPDCEELVVENKAIYDLYRSSGMPPAIRRFAVMIKSEGDADAIFRMLESRKDPFASCNWQYWFERELLYYPQKEFDVEVLRQHKAKLVLANGSDSNHDAFQYRANVEIAKELDVQVVDFPGRHMGFASHFKQFAEQLVGSFK